MKFFVDAAFCRGREGLLDNLDPPLSRRRQRQPHIVRSYFGGPHILYPLDENPMSL